MLRFEFKNTKIKAEWNQPEIAKWLQFYSYYTEVETDS